MGFFDIRLADGDSFEIFESVKIDFPIIFTTAYDEYALKAFKVNSVDYLLKPIGKSELSKSLEKYKSIYKVNRESKNEDLIRMIHELRQSSPKNNIFLGSISIAESIAVLALLFGYIILNQSTPFQIS